MLKEGFLPPVSQTISPAPQGAAAGQTRATPSGHRYHTLVAAAQVNRPPAPVSVEFWREKGEHFEIGQDRVVLFRLKNPNLDALEAQSPLW